MAHIRLTILFYFILLFSFTLFIYFILLYSFICCKIANFFFVLFFLFSFLLFDKRIGGYWLTLTKTCALKEGKKNIFEGKRGLMWLYTYGKKRSYIERDKHSDFRKGRKIKERKVDFHYYKNRKLWRFNPWRFHKVSLYLDIQWRFFKRVIFYISFFISWRLFKVSLLAMALIRITGYSMTLYSSVIVVIFHGAYIRWH